ncbi:MAG: hypothetical protein ACM3ZU_08055 [Bacteroidota bacterium]
MAMKFLWEQTYPYLIASVSAFAALVVQSQALYSSMIDSLSEVIGVGSIIVGFLGTAMAIVWSLGPNPFVTRVREAGVYERILGYMWVAIFVSLVLVAFSIALKLFNKAPWFGPGWKRGALAVWAGLVALMLCSSYRSIRIMYLFLRLASEDA